MNFIKQTIIRRMQKAGYSPHYAYIVFNKRWDDIFHEKDTTFRQKIWAQKRGFYSPRIANYGLTEENYKDYVSDFEYYRLHPINGIFTRWIDDKLTIRYILAPFSEYLPRYYYHLYDGEILRLPDCPENTGQTIDDIINLLKKEKALAVKLLASCQGQGFIKLGFDDGRFLVNYEEVQLEKLKTSIQEWLKVGNGGYLITEYLHPCRELSQFWKDTPNGIRISVIRNPHGTPTISGAYIRFGTQKTGFVDNANAGGVSCQIDLNDGRFFNGVRYEGRFLHECRYHPDTGDLLEGIIPNWSLIKEKIIEISQYISEVICMGYDILVTDEGFKIIEINSQQGLSVYQYFFPCMRNEITRTFFGRLLEEQRLLFEYRRSRTLFGRIRLFLQKCKIRLDKLKERIFPKN